MDLKGRYQQPGHFAHRTNGSPCLPYIISVDTSSPPFKPSTASQSTAIRRRRRMGSYSSVSGIALIQQAHLRPHQQPAKGQLGSIVGGVADLNCQPHTPPLCKPVTQGRLQGGSIPLAPSGRPRRIPASRGSCLRPGCALRTAIFFCCRQPRVLSRTIPVQPPRLAHPTDNVADRGWDAHLAQSGQGRARFSNLHIHDEAVIDRGVVHIASINALHHKRPPT